MILVGVHLALSVERCLEVRLVVLATAVGAVVEAIQLATGTYRFTSGTVSDALAPPWLLAMWAQFATTFRFSLRSVIMRPAPRSHRALAAGLIAESAAEYNDAHRVINLHSCRLRRSGSGGRELISSQRGRHFAEREIELGGVATARHLERAALIPAGLAFILGGIYATGAIRQRQ